MRERALSPAGAALYFGWRGHFQGEGNMLKQFLAAAALVSVGAAGLVIAQPTSNAPPMAPIKRTLLQKVDVPGANYETVTGIAEIMPNVNIGRHTHPGPETGYVIDGEMTLLVDGQPPLPLKAGDSYKIPPVAIHDVRTGDKGAKVLAVYVVEKGKPLASPAP
jgi:quercetin dioxygenase-like cupin family protein